MTDRRMAGWTAKLVWVAAACVLLVSAPTEAAGRRKTTSDTSDAVAKDVDRLLNDEFQKVGVVPAGRCSDEDFLRRITLDLTGDIPTPRDVTLFGLNPSPEKRRLAIEQKLQSAEFARNWGRYWRDVIFTAATEPRSRISQGTFEEWMTEQIARNRGWDQITTELLTATGDVREDGSTALYFAHAAEPDEVAAEASRIFLGIQVQCANCHDHPSDIWKRKQFHEFAAYFPRAVMRPKPGEGPMNFEIVSFTGTQGRRGDMLRENPEMVVRAIDRNRDGAIDEDEAKRSQRPEFAQLFSRLLTLGDKNGDKKLTAAEFKEIPQPDNRRGSAEYFMPDLNDPSSRGTIIHPKFFVDGKSPAQGLADVERRTAAAKAITSPENPWFARAVVNRIWSEMLGEGFYMPIDDLGPTRTARFPDVLDRLSKAFVANEHDLRWLFTTIANTEAYQRQIRAKSPGTDSLPFASATPVRLRADAIFSSLLTVLNVSEPTTPGEGRFAMQRSPRFQFSQLFGFDPSMPQEDILGNVPQALFVMNSPILQNAVSANGNSRLARLLRDNPRDEDALSELYLLVLCREPLPAERDIAMDHLKSVERRGEAFEDLMWSLLNSTEFLCRR